MSHHGTHEAYSVLGSGTVPTLNQSPALSGALAGGQAPIPDVTKDLRMRTGEAAAIINPEDFSVFLGFRHQAVAVNTSVTPIPQSPLENRRAITIHNNGPDIVYLGFDGVSTTEGFPLLVNEKIAFSLQGNVSVMVYGISEGASDVRIIEIA
jgi:hypothetical protein